jgi:hypothetical protein
MGDEERQTNKFGSGIGGMSPFKAPEMRRALSSFSDVKTSPAVDSSLKSKEKPQSMNASEKRAEGSKKPKPNSSRWKEWSGRPKNKTVYSEKPWPRQPRGVWHQALALPHPIRLAEAR